MPKYSAMNVFWNNVRSTMENTGVSQSELAARLGVSRAAVCQMLGNHKAGVTITRAERIAKALDVELVDLLSKNVYQTA